MGMNIYELANVAIENEQFDTLLTKGGVTIERIVSHGQATAEGEWYDQDWDEWVLILGGRAGLLLSGEPDVTVMQKGDSIFLPAHTKHRVEWTDDTLPTLWLAVHIREKD